MRQHLEKAVTAAGRPKRPVGRPTLIDDPRHAILAQAAILFSRNGFAETSLKDIADAVGMSKAAVYHYFPTKQVIYEAIVVDLLDRLNRHVADVVARVDDPVARIRAAMIAQAQFFEDNYTEYVTLLHGVGGLNRTVGRREAAIRDRYEMLIRGLVQAGCDAGALSVSDVAIAARAVLSMINWMVRWYKPAGPERAAAFGEEFFNLLYNGMRRR